MRIREHLVGGRMPVKVSDGSKMIPKSFGRKIEELLKSITIETEWI